MKNLGKYEINQIYNEDSYKAIKNIPNKSVDCIYTDIPYLIVSGGAGKSDLSKRIKKVNDEYLKNINNGIDYSIFDDFVRISKKINIFIWCSKMQILDIMNYFATRENVNYEILVWCKTNPTPSTNNTWLPNVEYCLYFREKGVKLNDGYNLKSKYYVSPINTYDKKIFDHPTIKPLECVKNHLLHATQENDVIADFFLGSGTTAVAYKEINRKFIGFENDEKYFKTAKDRLNGITKHGQTSIFTDFDSL
jgi:DNA modification methylase